MPEWFFWSVIISIALLACFALGWVWNDHRNYRKQVDANHEAWKAQQQAAAKAHEAKILAMPKPDTWNDTLDRL